MTRPKDSDPSTGNCLQQTELPSLEKVVANEQYRAYADGTGLLTIDQLSSEVATSPAFAELVGEIGWPNNRDDGEIVPITQFSSVEQFRAAFMNDLPRESDSQNLNNFRAWLRVMPGDEANDPLKNMSDFIYGHNPALYRAWAIAPDLFFTLREASNELSNFTGYSSDEALRSEDAASFIEAAKMAYEILGRLIKKDDLATHMRLIGSASRSSQVQEITHADQVLRM